MLCIARASVLLAVADDPGTPNLATLANIMARWTQEDRDAAAPAMWHGMALLRAAQASPADPAVRASLVFAATMANMPQPPTAAVVPEHKQSAMALYQWLLGLGLRLETFLAKGTYGAVFRATNAHGAHCAVKVAIGKDASESATDEVDTLRALDKTLRSLAPDQRAAARTEARHVNRFDAAYYIDAGHEWLEAAVFVMPLATGSVGGFIKLGVPCDDRVALVADLFLGMRAVHRAGRVLCDFKPENALVFPDPTGRTTRVFGAVSDFGMDADHAATQPSSTARSGCLGTYLFNLALYDAGNNTRRPRTFERDWFAFAKVCLCLLAQHGTDIYQVAAGVTAAVRGTLPDSVRRGFVPLGSLHESTQTVDGRQVVHRTFDAQQATKNGTHLAPLACTDPGSDAHRLATWAADFIDRVNHGTSPDTSPVVVGYAAFDATDPFASDVPGGLERAVAAAYADTDWPP